jgi:hypothetical protein
MSREASEQKIVSGEAWRAFCDRLKSAGDAVFAEGMPDDPFNRAEGTRYLTRLVRCALENFVEFADPAQPKLRRLVHETVKMGADNPDNWYENAPLHGDYEYRLYGTRGTIPYLSMQTQIGHYGRGGGLPPAGFLEAKDLVLEPDGTFEIFLSREQKPKNWLKLGEGNGTLVVRQTFFDKAKEERAQLTIERIAGPKHVPTFGAEYMAEGLDNAGSLVSACALIFPTWAKGFKKHTNQLPQFDPNLSRMMGGDPNIAYYHSYWELAPDEALLVEATPPACDFWNFQLNNFWMESLDYSQYQVCINKAGAKLRADGSVQIVVAHQNPGVSNWLDTAGHALGTMCLRWVRAAEHPQPTTRVVKLSEVTP